MPIFELPTPYYLHTYVDLQSNFAKTKATFILCSCVFQLFRKYRYLLHSGTANNAKTYSSVTFYTRPLPTFTVHTKNRERKKIWEISFREEVLCTKKILFAYFQFIILVGLQRQFLRPPTSVWPVLRSRGRSRRQQLLRPHPRNRPRLRPRRLLL